MAPSPLSGGSGHGSGRGGAASAMPLPGRGPAAVAVPAPGSGPGEWVGAPSAALDRDGSFVVAYRLRSAAHRGAEVVLARSDGGERLTPVARIGKDRFGAASLERPALLRTPDGAWRLYVCCATPGSRHWWITLLAAASPERLADATDHVVFPGDSMVGVKDPVIRFQDFLVGKTDCQWQAWICCHPLDVPDEEDRMTTAYATSRDGLEWEWHGTVLAPRPEMWDARGARLTTVLPDGRAAYDGRASKEENWFERIGLARLTGNRPGELEQVNDGAAADARYLDVLPLPDGGYRIYYEARLSDESHELRTELIR
jgi:hypothetical protein